MFQGETLRVARLDDGFAELCFDRSPESVNKLDGAAIAELRDAVSRLAGDPKLRGVLVTSAKPSFIVGADIASFGSLFRQTDEALIEANLGSNRILQDLEELPAPVVVAIGGVALGGGLEVALACDYRVVSEDAQLGLPEVKLGLMPGLGGTVRLPRIAGTEAAIQWITSGASNATRAALAAGVADEVVPAASLRTAALDALDRAAKGRIDWRARRAAKRNPVPIEAGALEATIGKTREAIARKAPPHQPAAAMLLELLGKSVRVPAGEALRLEAEAFAAVARTQAASSLIRIFLNEQQVRKAARHQGSAGGKVQRAAVIGAGIMGGGIAFASASRGIPVRLKDISHRQLELGMAEAASLLRKQVSAGRLREEQSDAVLAAIAAQSGDEAFEAVDLVVEAVVENLEVKQRVLRDLEPVAREDAIIASNTSSLRIDDLAVALSRPDRFVGMHFFNPVVRMPLVEIVRGSRTADAAVGTAVAYALALGKTPIVVRDGPGFLVNRIITPYMQAFGLLLNEGADFEQIDAAMEAFGWPMGPAYLNDVVGMDTGVHVAETIRAGFPERMRLTGKDALAAMVGSGRLGQKNGIGFYRYEGAGSGKPGKARDPDAHALLRRALDVEPRPFEDAVIIERMMIPLLIEAARCLEEGVVATPAELDMALVLGLGFPAYLGGALHYADWLGPGQVVESADRHASLGPLYSVTPAMRAMAAGNRKYY